jgi:hypothetical protein
MILYSCIRLEWKYTSLIEHSYYHEAPTRNRLATMLIPNDTVERVRSICFVSERGALEVLPVFVCVLGSEMRTLGIGREAALHADIKSEGRGMVRSISDDGKQGE